MTFVHCWGCMMRVTPSGRRLVMHEAGGDGLSGPVSRTGMEEACMTMRAWRARHAVSR